jgi:hypothetical protein
MEDDSEGGDRPPAWIVIAITTAGGLRPIIFINRTRLVVVRQGDSIV